MTYETWSQEVRAGRFGDDKELLFYVRRTDADGRQHTVYFSATQLACREVTRRATAKKFGEKSWRSWAFKQLFYLFDSLDFEVAP